jgi:hypothetical protein
MEEKIGTRVMMKVIYKKLNDIKMKGLSSSVE